MASPPVVTYIYKILPEQPPSPLPEALPLSTLDRNDGYIHLSTSSQVPGTANRFFGSASKLWLLRLRIDNFPVRDAHPESGNDALKGRPRIIWEGNSHGLFPHLYDGGLGSGSVEKVLAFERTDGQTWSDVLANLEE